MVFTFKKIISAFLMPVPIGLFLLLIAFIFLMKSSYTKAKVFSFLALFWFAAFTFQPVANALIKPLEDSHKALLEVPNVKYILVLGSGHNTNENLSITSQLRAVAVNRLSEGKRLHNKIANSKMIVSGYSGFDKNKHALMAKRFLEQTGVKEENILTMTKPVDTRMEAKEAKKIIGNEQFILVTSASHMKRSMLIFQKEGLNPIAAPTYHLGFTSHSYKALFSSFNLYKSKIAFHEYLGIAWGKLRGFI